MKYRIFAILTLFVLVLNLGGSSFADTKTKKVRGYELVAMLPASDGVFVFDAKRFFGEALPKILANNQPMLAKINGQVDDFRTRTGIDIRQFDSVAAGVTTRQIADKKYDIDPVIVARGQLTSGALIGAAKLASNGKYKEERVGDRVVYIFDAAKIVASQTTGGTTFDKMTELAVTALDDKTIAFGDVARVKQTLEGKTRVSPDLTSMLEANQSAVGAFAIKPPAGLKSFLPLENDELGKNIDSIQYVYGHAAIGNETATMHVTARTEQNAQASSLYDTLQGLQMVGKAFLGGARGADKQVYARMLENAKFAVKANEVRFDLTVPQSDIDILVGMLK